MKVCFQTLGCKLNQAETEALTRQFIEAGHQVVGEVSDADIYILNTCTVTNTADSKSRQLIRQAKRKNPNIAIVVTGCYAERAVIAIHDIEGVSMVLGNQGKDTLLEVLINAGLLKDGNATEKQQAVTRRTRAFVKIQDGCTNFCAYCIVPYVRGKEKSVESSKILEIVKNRVVEGYQEIVLTGTRIGAYYDNGIKLKDLVSDILRETDVKRLRLSSLQPQELSKELLDLWQDKRLCPHFHLSLQTGSESVLKRMKRLYNPKEYAKAVEMIRETVPDVAITTDIIVGFPGETEAEFLESLEFCRRMEFARIHVFVYSPRSGTAAAEMPNQVPDAVKKSRSAQMLGLARESEEKFKERFSGEILDVIWEKQTDEGEWSGVTGNYIRVFKRGGGNLANKLDDVKLD